MYTHTYTCLGGGKGRQTPKKRLSYQKTTQLSKKRLSYQKTTHLSYDITYPHFSENQFTFTCGYKTPSSDITPIFEKTTQVWNFLRISKTDSEISQNFFGDKPGTLTTVGFDIPPLQALNLSPLA